MNDTNTLAIGALLLAVAICFWGFRQTFRNRKPRRSWRDWYRSVYLKSSHWQKTRLKILERDNYTCQDCGGRGNQVHHLNYKRLWRERMSDLVTLCDACHGRYR